MAKIFKFFKADSSKKKFFLFFFASVMFLCVAGFVVYDFLFLISNFNKALGATLEPSFSGGFDIEGFEKLNLINPHTN